LRTSSQERIGKVISHNKPCSFPLLVVTRSITTNHHPSPQWVTIEGAPQHFFAGYPPTHLLKWDNLEYSFLSKEIKPHFADRPRLDFVSKESTPWTHTPHKIRIQISEIHDPRGFRQKELENLFLLSCSFPNRFLPLRRSERVGVGATFQIDKQSLLFSFTPHVYRFIFFYNFIDRLILESRSLKTVIERKDFSIKITT